MKRILAVLLVAVMLTSCTKETVLPITEAKQQQVVTRNQNISVVNISAQQTATKQVTFKFSTQYEKELESIEVLSGATESLFCRIWVDNKDGNSTSLKNYTVQDNELKSNVMYYMIKYTTKTGEWFVSDIYKVDLK
jgi:hypothetical protein